MAGKGARRRLSFPAAGVLVLAVVVAAGWIAFRERDLPHSRPAPAAAARPAVTGSPISFEHRDGGTTLPSSFVERSGTSLQGRVVDEQGDPAEGAKVTCRLQGLLPPDPLDVTDTDENGTFWFHDLPADWLAITVLREGYGARKVVRKLSAGEHAFVTVKLPQAACCEGRVVDERGEPLAEAMLRVLDRTQCLELGHVATEADGSFALCCVPAGDHLQMEVWKQGHLFVTRPDLEAPQTDVLIRLPRLGALRCRVVDGKGKPASAASLRWMPAAAHQEQEALLWRWFDPVAADPAKGTFAVPDVWPGEVELTLVAPGYLPVTRTLVVEPGAALEAGDVLLAPGSTVEGRVLDAALEPVSGATVATAFLTGDGRWVAEPPAVRGNTSEEGTFQLAAVPDTPFTVGVSRQPGRWQWFPDVRVVDFPQDLVLEPTGSVTGRVQVPWSSAASAALLRAVDACSFLPVEVGPERGGEFCVTDLTAGSWELQCADLWRAAERGMIGTRVVELQVAAGEERICPPFRLDGEGEQLSGRLRWGDQAVGHASLLVRSGAGDGGTVEGRCTTDEAGRFEFTGLSGGPASLEVVALQRGVLVSLAHAVQLPVPADAPALDLQLPQERVRLRVHPAVGSPDDVTARLRGPAAGNRGAWTRALAGGIVTVRADRDDLELEVSAPGCAPWRSETLAALDGATQDIHLPLEARLRVRIGAATGEPLVGAQVLVVGSRLGLVPAQSTDARGFTEFTRLPEGDVRVSVVVPGQAPAEQCIALRSGERSELEFRMPGD